MIKILSAKTWAFGMGENLSQMAFKQWVGMLWGGAAGGRGPVWLLTLT